MSELLGINLHLKSGRQIRITAPELESLMVTKGSHNWTTDSTFGTFYARIVPASAIEMVEREYSVDND